MEAKKLTADEVSDKCNEWQFLSFSEEEVVYDIVVNVDLLVVSCSCLGFEHRRRLYLLPTSLLAAEEGVSANVTDEAQQKTRSTVKIKAERCVQIEKALHHFNTDLTRMSSYGTDADISIVLKSYENALAAIQ
ncbi:hypothetical protein A0J61_04426 [Choanephora cucurbitarum]|uniref:Uncharacterized protein n=1 Tax=Choanephora cucurbitarum TaxID=101091 RepID=A0A1C7NEJ0_9FUNG|nr:hypothetical protein A0J61_04426 [Choanephora cucurbitarum]